MDLIAFATSRGDISSLDGQYLNNKGQSKGIIYDNVSFSTNYDLTTEGGIMNCAECL